MNEAFSGVVAIIMGAFLMFIMPMENMMNEADKTKQMYLLNESTVFLEKVRNTGEISEEMYIQLQEKIASMGGNYRLEIVHYGNIYSEDKEEVLYFETANYHSQIKAVLENQRTYALDKNEYIKIMVLVENDVVVCIGGSIK